MREGGVPGIQRQVFECEFGHIPHVKHILIHSMPSLAFIVTQNSSQKVVSYLLGDDVQTFKYNTEWFAAPLNLDLITLTGLRISLESIALSASRHFKYNRSCNRQRMLE
jgi:hypothetical protein